MSDYGKVIVISCGNATINVEANPFDVVLDSLYCYKDIDRENKLTLVLDEFQTLNCYKGCTLEAILSRGRKLNISAFIASQDYTSEKKGIGRVYAYCGTHFFFRPLGEECIQAVSTISKLDTDVIRTLPDFCCVIMGSVYSEYYHENRQLASGVVGNTYRPPYVGSYDDDNI